MIKSVTLENFFSFSGETKVDLNPGVNLLVGINGSGKSNFLKAFRLIFENFSDDGMGFNELIKRWNGIGGIINFCGKVHNSASVSIFIDKSILNSYKSLPAYSKLDKLGDMIYTCSIQEEVNFQWSVSELLDQLNDEGRWDRMFGEIDPWESIITNYKGKGKYEVVPLDFLQEFSIKNQIGGRQRMHLETLVRTLKGINYFLLFDTSENSPIRGSGQFDISTRLKPNAENFVPLLMRIKNHHPLVFEKFEEALKQINPNFKDIVFDPVGDQFVMMLREKGLAKSVFARHISDGTLRYLLLMLVFLNPEGGKVICIDEPEIGLHPDMILGVAGLMKEAVKNGKQLIVSTHSPILLNAFQLEDLLIFEKDKENGSIVRRAYSEDFDNDSGQLNLPGFLWMRGEIGGTRW